MTDKTGIKTAAEKGITLGEVGQRIVFENEHVRIWEINLDPGETIDFHVHFHPYIVISLGGGENEIETIFGDAKEHGRLRQLKVRGLPRAQQMFTLAMTVVNLRRLPLLFEASG